MLVHCFSGSPYTWRVLMVLNHKGIEHEQHYIPRQSGEHQSETLLTANPRGRLPIVELGELRLYESNAICRWLETEYPEPRLMPKGSQLCALAEIRIAEAAYLLPPFDDVAVYLFSTKPQERKAEVYDAKLSVLHSEFARWEGYLAAPDAHGRGGDDYLAGNEFSLADVTFFPLLAFVVRVGLRLEPRYPALARYYERVSALAPVEASWPPHWRESEGKDAGFAEYDRRHPA